MEGMKQCPDKCFDLAIVDPPYGKNIANIGKVGGDGGNFKYEAKQYMPKKWDKEIPDKKYFNELFRVSKYQIIWGGNYFIDYLKSTPCMIVWDKDNSGNFADCELAWTNFETSVRKIKWRWNGMLQQNMKNKEYRIHPTQKPVQLYRWLLKNYAKPGDKILDTHVGSASSLIACEREGFEYVGFEIDKDYYQDAKKRIERERAQLTLELQC